MPLKGTRAIHQRFSAAHQPAAESTMTGTCTIRRPSTAVGALDDATGLVTPAAATVIAQSIPCRAQVDAGQARTQASGGQEVTQRLYLVAVPIATSEVRVDDTVTVEASRDEHLVGRVLRVVDVTAGTEGWQYNLICRDNLG